MTKRFICWIMIGVLTLGTVLFGANSNVNAATVTDTEVNNGMTSAVFFSIGDVIEGNLSKTDSSDFYKFTVLQEVFMIS